MSLTTLTAVKNHLEIADTSEDTVLSQLIRGCSAAVRNYTKQYLGGLVASISVASAAVITAPGHGLQTGNTVYLGGTDCSPTLDGLRVVTRLTEDTFSVPITTTVAGTKGYWAVQYTEFYGGDGTQKLKLKQRPVISVDSLYYDQTAYYGTGTDPFNSSTLLVEGTDYVLKRDNASQTEVSLSGHVYGIGRVWTRPTGHPYGMVSQWPGDALGNIKITYKAGWFPIRDDLQLACNQFVSLVRAMKNQGAGLKSEQYDYYRYELQPMLEQDQQMGGIRQLLSPYRKWVW